jgi:beta-glucanase (GH16 family)
MINTIMNRSLLHLMIVVCILFFSGCSESADLKEKPDFRENFSEKRLSAFIWGAPTFSMYKFRADPAMVWNASDINYLELGKSKSDVFPTGFIYAKERFSYGSYSARIRVSDVPGAVGSFFTCTEIAKIFSDGTHDEIDFEFITARPHSVLMTTWYQATGMEGGLQTPTHNSFLWEDPSFNVSEWHVYRFDWFSDRVDFYIDGIIRWTSTRAVPRREMMIALHIYTIETWKEVEYPPKREVLQMTDWVEYRKFRE